jgi:radical SAM protein with 4Fe4S-binding SPASM domain
MTMMESNFREFPEYVHLGHELGIQEVKGVYLTAFDERMQNESLYGKERELKEVFYKAEQLGSELGIEVKLPYLQGEDIAMNAFHKECFTGWRDFFLGSDGYVRSCMSTSKKLFHIDKYSNFDEMWNSDEYQDFRESVNRPQMDKPCRNCYQASYANWNKKSAFIQIGNDFAPEWEG